MGEGIKRPPALRSSLRQAGVGINNGDLPRPPPAVETTEVQVDALLPPLPTVEMNGRQVGDSAPLPPTEINGGAGGLLAPTPVSAIDALRRDRSHAVRRDVERSR